MGEKTPNNEISNRKDPESRKLQSSAEVGIWSCFGTLRTMEAWSIIPHKTEGYIDNLLKFIEKMHDY